MVPFGSYSTMALNSLLLNSDLLQRPLFLALLGLTILCLATSRRRRSHPRLIPGVHIVGIENGGSLQEARKRFVSEADQMLEEGYKAVRVGTTVPLPSRLTKVHRETKGDLFYVPSTMGERLMIPTKYLSELKNAADSDVDFTASFVEVNMD